MKNKKIITILIIVLLLVPIFSGCIDSFFNLPTTYEAHPTKISYTIRYGYIATCTGSGEYTINYDCDISEVLRGTSSYHPLYAQGFEVTSIVNNNFLRWNISGEDVTNYELGITASVVAESYLESDLTGAKALTVQEINTLYPEVTEKYLKRQKNASAYLIDPTNSNIKQIAQNVVNKAETENSFLLAKALFLWLKENTAYKIHNDAGSVQPASVTFQKKTGDCDDLSFLYISLCRSVGIPARFIRGYLLSEEGNGDMIATPHAWTEVFVGGSIGNDGWIPVECACDCDDNNVNVNQNFGVENAFHLRLFIDDGSDESMGISLSGIYYSYEIGRTVKLQSFAEVEDFVEIESKKLVVTNEDQRSYQS